MRVYGKIKTSLWRSRKFRGLRDDDARLCYLYLHSCQHVNLVGCFVLPESYAMADLEWPLDRYLKALDRLCDSLLVAWDKDNETIRIIDFLAHDPFTNPKHAIGAVNVARQLPDGQEKTLLFQELITHKYCDGIAAIPAELQRLSIGYPKAIETKNLNLNLNQSLNLSPFPFPVAFEVDGSAAVAVAVDCGGGEQGEGEVFPSENFMGELRAAVGLVDGAGSRWWFVASAAAHVLRWRDELGLTPEQIIATARASRAKQPEAPRGPKGLDGWMQTASASLAAPAGAGVGSDAKSGQDKPRAVAPSEAELVAYYAGVVNGDGYIPPSMFKPSTVRLLLDRGAVTLERLQVRGVI